MKEIMAIRDVETKIYLIRGHKVMLDVDLAELYQVLTKALNRQVRRNLIRFPSDFMFKLTTAEVDSMRCQFGTSNETLHLGRGGRRYLPYVFTEQGVSMLSSVLKSERAALVNIAIMRAFVGLRKYLSQHKDIAEKLHELELRMDTQDGKILSILNAIKALVDPTLPRRKAIGFRSKT